MAGSLSALLPQPPAVCWGRGKGWSTGKMNPRVFLDVDPRTLRLPGSRRSGADPLKLHRQIAQFGTSVQGMPPLEVSRGTDGELVINNGVTRATRVARLLPGAKVRVEVIDDLPIPVGSFPSLGDLIP
jgi:hypothetical protein